MYDVAISDLGGLATKLGLWGDMTRFLTARLNLYKINVHGMMLKAYFFTGNTRTPYVLICLTCVCVVSLLCGLELVRSSARVIGPWLVV